MTLKQGMLLGIAAGLLVMGTGCVSNEHDDDEVIVLAEDPTYDETHPYAEDDSWQAVDGVAEPGLTGLPDTADPGDRLAQTDDGLVIEDRVADGPVDSEPQTPAEPDGLPQAHADGAIPVIPDDPHTATGDAHPAEDGAALEADPGDDAGEGLPVPHVDAQEGEYDPEADDPALGDEEVAAEAADETAPEVEGGEPVEEPELIITGEPSLIDVDRSNWSQVTVSPYPGVTHHHPHYFTDWSLRPTDTPIRFSDPVETQLQAAMQDTHHWGWDGANALSFIAQPIEFGVDFFFMIPGQIDHPIWKDVTTPAAPGSRVSMSPTDTSAMRLARRPFWHRSRITSVMPNQPQSAVETVANAEDLDDDATRQAPRVRPRSPMKSRPRSPLGRH